MSTDVLTPEQLSAETGIALQTLANWRWQRRGPRFVKTSPGKGGRVMYPRRYVDEWMDSQTVSTAPG